MALRVAGSDVTRTRRLFFIRFFGVLWLTSIGGPDVDCCGMQGVSRGNCGFVSATDRLAFGNFCFV